MKRIGLIAALVLVAVMVPAGIYAMQNAPDPTDKASDAAMKFLKLSSTYAFDGSASSVRVADIRSLGGEPAQFEVELEFESMHGGYGDRTGIMVTQAITPHTMTVKVVGGEVAEAVTDGRWNEIGQEAKPVVMPPLVTPISGEEARDAALDYIFGAYLVTAPLPRDWKFNDVMPRVLLGYEAVQYSGEGWRVTVKHAVVIRPDYSVSVEYVGEGGFTWSCSVDSYGNVTETETSLEPADDAPDIFGIEDARDMAVNLILGKHPELRAATPSKWAETNLNPAGLVGYSKIEYVSGGWTVVVEGPVVWKPDYKVEASYKGAISFTWKGLVPNGGPAQELELVK